MNFFGEPYWDLTTTILYIVMGLVPVWAIYETDKRVTPYKKWWKNPYFIVWIVIWTIFGGGRLVVPGIGGTDAPAYMQYFESCLNPSAVMSGVMWQYNSNIGFRWLNRFLRLFSSNGYFFIVVSSFLLVACPVYFLSKLRLKAESCIPYFLIVFWFVRGFCTIRSHFAIAAFLIAICLMFENKKKLCLIVAIYAALLHPMVAVYFPFIIIYLVKKNLKIGLKTVTLIFFLSFLIIIPIKTFFLQNISIFGDFSEHYEGYVHLDGNGFFDNAWKLAFEQLVLFVFIIFSNRGLKRYAAKLTGNDLAAYNIIYKLCLYDILLIPVCYALNIWRGYEVCYIPRLIMWAILIHIGAAKCPKTFKWLYNLLIFGLFIVWFLQRTGAESFWRETSLMPYVFAPMIAF